MTLSREIVATWRGPGAVVSRLYAEGQREDRALMLLMAACALFFISQMPQLARQAHLDGADLNPRLGGALMAWVVIAPLLFYALAFVAHLLAKLLGGQGTAYGARLALFWALLASAPLLLLNGLVAGLIGPGLELTLVGVAWTIAFLWFWIAGMVAVNRRGAT
ncbi:YIP1 family protein [Citreicella sp. C3M06]|uniref:YIP1 family protein n=1 Tax=Roseobacteraceae TaxID=2854170 RepID=UPI001C085118|nr:MULTISPECIES: YIP1 family protein [Roseobacteraceae]MBU2961582.1 YIP1 family protein [Citreicella sp. C3M06]MDO6585032.1 YIP1 family protein [Salipiger sp. 1_MG-2023]